MREKGNFDWRREHVGNLAAIAGAQPGKIAFSNSEEREGLPWQTAGGEGGGGEVADQRRNGNTSITLPAGTEREKGNLLAGGNVNDTGKKKGGNCCSN